MIIEKTQGCSFYFWNSNHERVMKNIIIFGLILSLVASPRIFLCCWHTVNKLRNGPELQNSIYDFLVSLPRLKLLVVQELIYIFFKVAKNWEHPNVQNLFRFLQISFWSKRWRKTGTEFRSTHTSKYYFTTPSRAEISPLPSLWCYYLAAKRRARVK